MIRMGQSMQILVKNKEAIGIGRKRKDWEETVKNWGETRETIENGKELGEKTGKRERQQKTIKPLERTGGNLMKQSKQEQLDKYEKKLKLLGKPIVYQMECYNDEVLLYSINLQELIEETIEQNTSERDTLYIKIPSLVDKMDQEIVFNNQRYLESDYRITKVVIEGNGKQLKGQLKGLFNHYSVLWQNILQLKFINFDATAISDLGWMLIGLTQLEEIDLSGLKINRVDNMQHILSKYCLITRLDIMKQLAQIDWSKQSNLDELCLNDQEMREFDISSLGHNKDNKIESLCKSFYNCQRLRKILNFTPDILSNQVILEKTFSDSDIDYIPEALTYKHNKNLRPRQTHSLMLRTRIEVLDDNNAINIGQSDCNAMQMFSSTPLKQVSLDGNVQKWLLHSKQLKVKLISQSCKHLERVVIKNIKVHGEIDAMGAFNGITADEVIIENIHIKSDLHATALFKCQDIKRLVIRNIRIDGNAYIDSIIEDAVINQVELENIMVNKSTVYLNLESPQEIGELSIKNLSLNHLNAQETNLENIKQFKTLNNIQIHGRTLDTRALTKPTIDNN